MPALRSRLAAILMSRSYALALSHRLILLRPRRCERHEVSWEGEPNARLLAGNFKRVRVACAGSAGGPVGPLDVGERSCDNAEPAGKRVVGKQ